MEITPPMIAGIGGGQRLLCWRHSTFSAIPVVWALYPETSNKRSLILYSPQNPSLSLKPKRNWLRKKLEMKAAQTQAFQTSPMVLEKHEIGKPDAFSTVFFSILKSPIRKYYALYLPYVIIAVRAHTYMLC